MNHWNDDWGNIFTVVFDVSDEESGRKKRVGMQNIINAV